MGSICQPSCQTVQVVCQLCVLNDGLLLLDLRRGLLPQLDILLRRKEIEPRFEVFQLSKAEDGKCNK